MFRNYFKTAWRNLRKSKGNAAINIAGLSIGMAVALLIGLWLNDELSFNRQFNHYSRIAQVIQNVTNNGEVETWRNVPLPLAEELRSHYGSDFKHVVMVINWGDHQLKLGDKQLLVTGMFMEKGGPDMLSLQMRRGKRDVLGEPNSVLISESAAKAYFGNEDPINKSFEVDGMPPVKVAGVYADLPHNSSFSGLDLIMSYDFLYANMDWLKQMDDPWRPNFVDLFVELNDNADFAAVSARIRDAKLKKVNEQLAKKKPTLFLDPMSRWHLYSEFENGVNAGGAIQYVWMFGIIGVFVLLLACINFMNLSTARSEKRAREVGIRKTVGSRRSQLVGQFFSESLLTVFLAFLVALLLVRLSIPAFNVVSNKQISMPWNQPVFWIMSLAFIVVTGLLAGSYPALFLSSFRPTQVLKGTFRAGRLAVLPRKVLVVVQFTVSVTLIIGTGMVYRQIQFAKNRPVGYDRSGLLAISMRDDKIHHSLNAFKDELVKSGAVLEVAESNSPTTGVWSSSSGFSWKGKDPNLSIDFGNVSVSYDYGKTIQWEIVDGRDFSRDFPTDSSAVIINEAAAKYMQMDKPVGEILTWWGEPHTIVGVVRNLVIESPYSDARPIIYNNSNEPPGVTLLRLNPHISARDAIARIEPIFRKFDPEQTFDYQFTDETYARKFGNEERIGKLAGFFALLAILISCLGLFGLASFMAAQRSKEIGVRKVLGASIFNIWNLLSREFLLLVFVAFFIATPLAYYFTWNWLQHYEYRTSLPWWVFAAAGAGSVLITVLVVSFQTVRAAVANPVRSLRSE